MIFDKYPYTNFHEMNDDWLIQTLREFGQRLDEFVAANSLTYADPIGYDPEAIYAANTVVIYDNAAYVSKKAIPAGMLPTNDEYWLLIFPFGDLIDQDVNEGMQQIVNMLPAVVDTWMTNHPDVTTTVQDGAINWLKLHNELKRVLLAGYSESSSGINIDEFEQGAINIENGEDAASTILCRTGFITFPKGITLIRTMSDFRIQVFQYTLDGTFEYRAITDARLSYMPFVTDENHKYRISISHEDYSTLTPADLPVIPVSCRIYAETVVMKSAIAAEYSSERTYDVNEYVFHSGALYRCITAITTAEEWTAAHWTAAVLGDDVSDLKGALDQYVLDRYDFVYPTNWYNPAEVESGEIYRDGSLHASTTRSHTGYIPVQEGDKVQLFRTGPITAAYRRHVACYDANKVVVPNTGSDSSNDAAYTVPSGVKYVIYTFDNALISQTFNLIIVRDGIRPTSYTPYFEPYSEIIDDFITPETEGIVNKVKNNELSTTNLINRYGCALPHTTLRQTVGMSEVWYFANMGTPNGCEYSVTNAGNPLKRLNKGVEFSNTTALTSSYGFYWAMYDILLNVIRQDKASGQGYPRRIVAENLSNCTVLAIGDSTIDSDYLTGGMLSYFNDKGKTLTLLGTLGDGSETNRNEGRSGWKASDYFTNKKYNGVTNPFYNPTSHTFDFAYYMTNQGYTAPDFVILQLGINDMYNSYNTDGIIESTYRYIKDMVDSILAYNGNIKVLINLPTPPNSDKSRHTNTEFLYWNTIIRYNDYALVQIKATYEESKVRCTYCHLILDPDTDIADTVHPTQNGYSKMAMEVINQINCWQNGN